MSGRFRMNGPMAHMPQAPISTPSTGSAKPWGMAPVLVSSLQKDRASGPFCANPFNYPGSILSAFVQHSAGRTDPWISSKRDARRDDIRSTAVE